MSASAYALSKLPPGQKVLGELLHSISQPLTTLRISLELSIDEIAQPQQKSVCVALQQTEKVIAMIQLMREYLDTEMALTTAPVTELAPALRSVIEELTSIAAVRNVRLRLIGTCTATVSFPASRLRLALQYLFASIIEAQPTGGRVMLLLGEGPAGAVLRAEGARSRREDPAQREVGRSASLSTLRKVRLAIAGRVLEIAGASLVLSGSESDPHGFVLRVAHRLS
jgi:signal transduction histidine kinase